MKLKGKNILLGITGSIAAYKAAILVRLLVKEGANVKIVMTELAKEFITPLTLATLSKNPILVDFFDPENGQWNSHVDLGSWSDVYLIAPATTVTRNLNDVDKATGNIYETVVIVSKRANQISSELKEELNRKLEEFASYTDNLEEVFENREQIEISRFYERLPKPTLIAMQEYIDEQIYFRKPASEETES